MLFWSPGSGAVAPPPRRRPVVSWFVAVLAVVVAVVVPATWCGRRPETEASFAPDQVSKLSSGLVVVVTGANSGLGYDTVRHLLVSKNGGDDGDGGPSIVVMACRNVTRCQAARRRIMTTATFRNSNGVANATKVLTLELDLSDRGSVRSFARRRLPVALRSAAGRDDVPIDVLVNNAGIFARDPSGVVYQQGTDEHVLVNHLGHVLLMHHLWPKLVRDKTRIVAVSSISALLPVRTTSDWYFDRPERPSLLRRLWNAACPPMIRRIAAGMISYGRSKRANILFADELHRRYSHLGVSSVASHPGIASTDIWKSGGKIFPAAVADFFHGTAWMGHSSERGAAAQVWAAVDREAVPSGHYVGPRWWFRGPPVLLGPMSSSRGLDDDSRYERIGGGVSRLIPHFWPFSSQEGAHLWNQSLHALGIEEFGK